MPAFTLRKQRESDTADVLIHNSILKKMIPRDR
jgi:hypothetical protein